MDEPQFHKWLRKSGRTEEVAQRVIRMVEVFAGFLEDERAASPDTANPKDLESFVEYVEQSEDLPTHEGITPSPQSYLWALRYYYQFTKNPEMERYAANLRAARIKRQPFKLKDFRGIAPETAAALQTAGIKNVNQMLKAGKTAQMRQALAAQTGLPLDTITELVRLSDLARIPGIKTIRARLYHDAGVDSIEKMAMWEPEALHAHMAEFVERTDFDGTAPLPDEVLFSIKTAKKLPVIVELE